MLFEVIRDGVVLMHTTDKKGIPSPHQLRVMLEKGYLFKKNGKPYKPPASRRKDKNSDQSV